MRATLSTNDFSNGLVFGFDIGTGSIGWAVRQGTNFKDVGVLICPEETGKLDTRRNLRRQRRTLRSKKYRRQWFARELAARLGLQLVRRGEEYIPLPESAWTRNGNGGWVPKPGFDSLRDPAALRVAAVEGKELRPEELFTALTHLFRRRGYTRVPWTGGETRRREDAEKEEGKIKEAVSAIEQALGDRHPCQLLAERKNTAGDSPTTKWGRQIYWPRERLEKEFRAIVEAQAQRHPALAKEADWLLYGGTHKVKGHRVYFKQTEARNPGVLGLKWPRFDNRGPALDALRPLDEQGRPLHVVRKNKKAFAKAQWELAVMNFRVIDRNTGAKVAPDIRAMARLREMWESSRRKKKAKEPVSSEPSTRVEIKLPLLRKFEKEFAEHYKLIDGQQPLTPQTGAGRARYSTPTLELIREQLEQGTRFDPPQPILRRPRETARQALDRYLADIKHPLVRHRLVLFSRLLEKLVRQRGEPDLIVLEAVRSLALSEKNKRELQKRNKENQDERNSIRHELAGRNASASRKAILRYRLWKEAQCTCPFCGDKITQEQLLNGQADIEHLVPRTVVDCNEFYNLTVGHLRCNREIKGNRTPFHAFGRTDKWPQLRDNAEKCFKGRKLEIFLSDKAEELIEQKADLQHTAYIARVIRHVALVQLEWTGEDGRDPTTVKGNTPSSSFQVTNGQITSRLRQSWGLNQILHPLPEGKRWDDLTDAEKDQMQQKNRGDLRHHALDAMVIACTLPWLAHRTVGATDPESGEHGWWRLDERTQRSLAINPVFQGDGQMHRVAGEWMKKVVVRHHVSSGKNRKFFDTTRYGKREAGLYIARKVLAKMKPAQLRKVYPKNQSIYLCEAWKRFTDENPDVEAILKDENQGKDQGQKASLPARFISRLCFSDYQKWVERQRTGEPSQFRWPDKVKIPFKSVSVIADDGDNAMFETAVGSKTYVSQTEYKEVRVFLPPKGKKFIGQFIRPWVRKSTQNKSIIPEGSMYFLTLRKGDVLLIKKPVPDKKIEAGTQWIVKKTSADGRISILPNHLASNVNILESLGYDPISFVRISLHELTLALGCEPPHPPSAQSQPPGAVQA